MTIIELHADSDWKAAGLEGNGENAGIISKINTRLHTTLQRLLGSQFETLFEKMHRNVKYFVIFCNRINLLDLRPITMPGKYVVQTPLHWRIREQQQWQTSSESEAPCHPGIPRERHVCNVMRFFIFQHT